jgi:hypothetical protein
MGDRREGVDVMSREWKPGDVATVNGEPITFYENEDTSEVMFTNAHGYQHPARHLHPDARPLVVIDPDSGVDLSRLWRLLPDNLVSIDQLQAALREFANPPPPIEEPTALYAVVLDRTDNEWCHIGGQVWRSLTSTGQFMVEKHWHDTDSPLEGNVVILSPGVTS